MRRPRDDHDWRAVLVAGIALAVATFVVPPGPGRAAVALATAVGAVVCVAIGIRRFRPSDPAAWSCLAAGIGCFALGDLGEAVAGTSLHKALPVVSLANAAYLVGYPFLFVGVARLVRQRGGVLRREDVADTGILALAAGSVAWHFAMDPFVGATTLPVGARVLVMAYPVLDLALVFLVIHPLLTGARLRPAATLLGVGFVCLLAADVADAVAVIHGHPHPGPVVDVWYLAQYVLVAVAALHPSVAGGAVVTPADPRAAERRETHRRTPLVAAVGLVAPLLLLSTAWSDGQTDILVLASLATIVLLLLFLRMSWLLSRVSEQTAELRAHAEALEAFNVERDTLEEELRQRAFHDELTGLANRALLYDRVANALDQAARSDRLVALCFGDLDGFKTVNDTLGHDVGDAVLVQTSRLLSSIVRAGDTVARLGGDEFAFLLVDVDQPETAVDFAGRIVGVLRDAQELQGEQIGLSISVGVAFAGPGKTAEQLISEADAAMYDAKDHGKNRVEVFEPSMRWRMVERLEISSGFRGALARGELCIDYQPIFTLADGGLVGFEALVRWHHPTLGLLEPGRFIPAAEDTGFIVPLGRWVLTEALGQLAAWDAAGGIPVWMSVNVSRRQLLPTGLPDELDAILGLHAIDHGRLMLEIAEEDLMRDPERTVPMLDVLHRTGVRVAVDDFGAGHSSLNRLAHLPVDVLKLDRSFVAPLDQSGPKGTPSAALVTAVVGLATSLGLEIVAEGVESDRQRVRLAELGCTYGQGLLLGPPGDHEEAARRLGVASRGEVPPDGNGPLADRLSIGDVH